MNEKNEPKGTKLTRKQREAIPHLVGCRSLEEGRRAARVGKATLYKWMREEVFQRELTAQREAVIKETLDRLKSSISQAVDRLVQLLNNAAAESVQLRAAEGILNFFLKARELEELTERITIIERIVFERKTSFT